MWITTLTTDQYAWPQAAEFSKGTSQVSQSVVNSISRLSDRGVIETLDKSDTIESGSTSSICNLGCVVNRPTTLQPAAFALLTPFGESSNTRQFSGRTPQLCAPFRKGSGSGFPRETSSAVTKTSGMGKPVAPSAADAYTCVPEVQIPQRGCGRNLLFLILDRISIAPGRRRRPGLPFSEAVVTMASSNRMHSALSCSVSLTPQYFRKLSSVRTP